MKRDMDLVRKILLACEVEESGYAPREFEIDGASDAQIGYHIMLVAEAGLLVGHDISTLDGVSPAWIANRLTWQGHGFLDAAKDPTAWAKAMSAASAAGGMAFDVLKSILVSYGTQQASKLMGISS